MKCLGITATEAVLPVLAKSSGLGYPQQDCFVASLKLVEHLCGDEHVVRKFRTIRRQPGSARWRREYVDKLMGDPFNPEPKSSTAMGSGDLPVDPEWGTRASPNVNIDEALGDEVLEPAATKKRWYVTEALVREHGRTMGCPRCSSGIGMHNAPWTDRRNPAATKPHEADRRRRDTSWPNNDEVSADGDGEANGPATQHGGSSGSGVQRNDAPSIGATRVADEKPTEAPDVEMGADPGQAGKDDHGPRDMCAGSPGRRL